MQTLSYGYKKPQTGDKGVIFWPALEFDIQRLNDHNHDGINSAKISSSSIDNVAEVVTPTWVYNALKFVYEAEITMPGSLLYASNSIEIRENYSANREKLHLTYRKGSANNKFVVECNDNNITSLYIVYL